MKKTLTSAQATYMPQTYKSFEGVLGAFLAEQCPQIGGSMTRQVLVCKQKAMTTEQIAFATGRTKRLIKGNRSGLQA